jgi:hypothetical protein
MSKIKKKGPPVEVVPVMLCMWQQHLLFDMFLKCCVVYVFGKQGGNSRSVTMQKHEV